jgi:hypothetical protein
MIQKAKDLSPEQKMAIESLLGRAVAEDESISVRRSPGMASAVLGKCEAARTGPALGRRR